MNYIEQIAIASPWWTDRNWSVRDRHILAAERTGFSFRHLDTFEPSVPAVDIIRGPRQVGKTTEIKLIIRQLLADGIPARAIGYFTCDILSKHRELYEVLSSFYHHLIIENQEMGFLFLDEITSVKEWQKSVKAFVDLGMGDSLCLVLTGSSVIELKYGYERMPGRRGGGRDYLFLPLSFRDFVTIHGTSFKASHSDFTEICRGREAFDLFRHTLLQDQSRYSQLLSGYLHHGGFPRCVADFLREGDTSDETLVIYQSVLFSEFEKFRKSIPVLINLMREIRMDLGNPVSFTTLMKHLDVASPTTVKEYFELWTRSFLGMQAGCLDMGRRKAFLKKNKKFYVLDPVLFRIAKDRFGIPMPGEPALAENSVAVHLLRLYASEWAEQGSINSLFYWKSKAGKEVDFVVYLDDRPFGLEVKYQRTISAYDGMGIKRGIGRGIIITRDDFEWGEVPKIPLWAFLLLHMG